VVCHRRKVCRPTLPDHAGVNQFASSGPFGTIRVGYVRPPPSSDRQILLGRIAVGGQYPVELHTRIDAEFGEDVTQVVFDRSRADE
jgi:hypothetical protein